MSLFIRRLWLAAAVAFLPTSALAHGFGQRYDLPVPLGLFILGAGASVVLSFLGMGFFVRKKQESVDYPGYNLLASPLFGWMGSKVFLLLIRVLSIFMFCVTLAAGFWGTENPDKNIVPTMVWIIWWVGLAYVCALIGNLWSLVNPWSIIFSWAEVLYRKIKPGDSLSLEQPYPENLGVWPAVGLFLWFAWAEIVWPHNDLPRNLAVATLGYSIITWTGMFLYGKEAWLERGEAFSIMFGVMGRFSITETRVSESGKNEWRLRPPAVGLLNTDGMSNSMVVLLVLMLATVSFDGFTETPLWHLIRAGIYEGVVWVGRDALLLADTMALIAAPALFLGVYYLFCMLMRAMSGSALSTGEFARLFVLSLVPIAIGYHVAHYFSFLFIQGQRIIPLLSDPFGVGWNLWGTAAYKVDIGIIGAKTTWYASIAAIVIGHICAVYLAHVTALRALENRFAAVRSQYPMLILMVGYTMVSLWIIAQPITGG
ncbi:MAG: hypothetical protein F4X91_10645 [Nitrospinae bacterium]|nr:hypothetical protein [Nitrospinota bacterium]